jgi:hypothetical protein
MTIFRIAAAAALVAAPLSFSPAFAQDMMDDAMGGEMMAHDMNVTCNVVDMGEMGMTIEFHNMGDSEIPAGTMGHWMVPGVAQGDVSFMDAVAPNGMKEQMYESQTMMHGSASSPCHVDMM